MVRDAEIERLVRDRSLRGLRVLDAAGGRGRTARSLVAEGARVVLLDLSAEVLGEVEPTLRDAAPRVQGDVRGLPFPAACFDVVVLRAVLHHLVDPAGALREAARVARPGGAVLLVDKAAPDDIVDRSLANAVERLRHSGHVWAFCPRELRNLAGAARLEVEEETVNEEERDAEEWLEGGTAEPPWDERVREYLRADAAAGGRALGTHREGDRLVLRQRWAALLLRKGGEGR